MVLIYLFCVRKVQLNITVMINILPTFNNKQFCAVLIIQNTKNVNIEQAKKQTKNKT